MTDLLGVDSGVETKHEAMKAKKALKEVVFILTAPLLLPVEVIRRIYNTLHELGAPIITKEGWEVLNDPEKLKEVMKAHGR